MLSIFRKQDRLDVHRTMYYVQYLHCVGANAIENQIVAVDASPDPWRSMPLKERIALRHGAQLHTIAAQFLDSAM